MEESPKKRFTVVPKDIPQRPVTPPSPLSKADQGGVDFAIEAYGTLNGERQKEALKTILQIADTAAIQFYLETEIIKARDTIEHNPFEVQLIDGEQKRIQDMRRVINDLDRATSQTPKR